ncbi:uncharacterized protein TNCV_3827151 [Trichonephila clavipes]|nr:uncharacterized protein TNCV_3827151 [Trichonephila clavipes]
MDVCKCIAPLWPGGTLNSHQAESPLVRLVEEEKRGKALKGFAGVLPQNWCGTQPNRTVTCMVLKATAYDKHSSSSLP